MKRITFLLCFVLLSKLTFAQQQINTTFANQMNTLFGQLDKNKIPDGILLDYGMEFTNLDEFNGVLSTNNYVTIKSLEEIYKTLLTSKISNNANGLVNPTVFKSNLKNNRAKGIIALSGLYFKYGKFKSNALTGNLINYSNGKFYDIPNKVPYETKQTFAITPAILKYSGLNFQVKIPSNIFYSNNTSQIQSIQIDFNNGNGYVTLPFNQNITVNYTSEGLKTWKYKLNLTNGTSLYSHSKINIEEGYETYTYGSNNQQKSTTTGVSRYPCKKITATDSYLGKKASVNLTIDYIDGNNTITKPLIVAEGFDVGVILSPESEFGYSGYRNFRESLNDSGELNNLITGDNKEYDIIYVDWDNGVDYLQRNAFALEEVIKWVNQQKSIAGSTEPNVILGQSMGGVIGRWAMADMEERGLNHDTRLFISHDAPQQGANIPIAMQYMLRHIDQQFLQTLAGTVISIFTNVDDVFTLLDTPATKQLLKNRANSNYGIENNEHDTFYNQLKNKGLNNSGGYPLNSRNIAISNGSECGETQDFNPGDDLLNINESVNLSYLENLITPIALFWGVGHGSFAGSFFNSVLNLISTSGKFNVNFNAKAIPYGTGNQIYKGEISYTKVILWLVSITTEITNLNKNQPNTVLPFDSYGGGYYNISNFIDTSTLPNGVYLRDKFSFIPTASALDIGNNNIVLNDTDYLRSYKSGNPPTGTKSSPFDNFSSDFDENLNTQNKPHISFNPRNGDWLAEEIRGNQSSYQCLFNCGTEPNEISGDNYVCDNEIKTYSINVPICMTNGIWNVSPNLSIISQSYNSIRVSHNTSSPLNSGYISYSVSNLNFEITKGVIVGSPKINSNGGSHLNVQKIGNVNLYAQQWSILKANYITLLYDTGFPYNYSFEWSIPNSQIRSYGNSSEYKEIKPNSSGQLNVGVRVRNECGCSNWNYFPFDVIYGGNNGGFIDLIKKF
jgi:hypothetical protein